MFKNLSKYYPKYNYFLQIIPILVSFIYTIIKYPLLGDQIPKGISIDGNITGYFTKNIFTAFAYPFASVVLYVLLLGILYAFLMRQEKMDVALGLSEAEAEKIGYDKLENFRIASIKRLSGAITSLIIALSLNQIIRINIALEISSQILISLSWLFYYLALGLSILYYLDSRKVRNIL